MSISPRSCFRSPLYRVLLAVAGLGAFSSGHAADDLPKVPLDDQRASLRFAPFVGLAIDSFAAGSVGDYLNEEASGDVKERATAGFTFGYRLKGDPAHAGGRDRQLWLYGLAIHGVRSTDVDCRATPSVPVCTPFSTELQNPEERGLYILRTATTLEGHAGLRWEFKTLQTGDANAARAYVSGQLGFVSVAGAGSDIADVHQLAVGAIVTRGAFEHSFFEIGYGRNDLMLRNPTRRLKANAHVEHAMGKRSGFYVFAHIAVDVDGGSGSDSIQSYFGFMFPLSP